MAHKLEECTTCTIIDNNNNYNYVLYKINYLFAIYNSWRHNGVPRGTVLPACLQRRRR